MKLATCIAVLCFVHIASGAHDFLQEYRFSAALDGNNYMLHWTVDLQAEVINFALNVSTTGWVGFGLSPNGQMPGSDVVIAWIDSNGQVFLADRYAVGRYLPPVDDSQDWTLIGGEEENGRTLVEFSRPLESCDTANDLDITTDTARVVWAYHSRDPESEDELALLEHERKGSASLNLLGGLNEERVVEDSQSFTILNDNVLIPSNDTTYWCTVHALPNETVSEEKFIYKFSPVIAEPSAPFVHHLVVYLCTNLDHAHVGTSTRCSGESIDIQLCRFTGVLFAAWAVGGADFVFPEDVAYPIGGESGQKFLVLEIHYDNPQMIEGVVDNSGLEFFYSNEEPLYRAGLLTLGHASTSSLIIPPGADNYVVNGYCPGTCTDRFLPETGINIFGNFLHTHLAGHGLVVRHFRENEECGGLEELKPIDENRNYDFNYQQTTILPRPVQVLPGDEILLECFYRTSDPSYSGVTLGGESTRQEMCISFAYYYPETDLTYCVGAQDIPEEFTNQYLSDEHRDVLNTSITSNDYQSVENILNQVEWNPQSINSLQTVEQYNAFCYSIQKPQESLVVADALPEATCPYETPAKDCPISGATRIKKNIFSLFSIIVMLYFVL